jgi:hypothetical protein
MRMAGAGWIHVPSLRWLQEFLLTQSPAAMTGLWLRPAPPKGRLALRIQPLQWRIGELFAVTCPDTQTNESAVFRSEQKVRNLLGLAGPMPDGVASKYLHDKLHPTWCSPQLAPASLVMAKSPSSNWRSSSLRGI